MGDKVVLTAEERSVLGKKVKQLRREGMVPAVVYGHKTEAKPIMAKANEATKVWHTAGKHHPVELVVGAKKHLALIKTADVDPVKHKVRHLSFFVLKATEKVETEVPLKVADEGQTPAERNGLVVLQALENVAVKALPNKLPDAMQVASEKLVEPGDHVTIADITPIDGVEVLADPEVVVASVYEPSALAAANDAAGGDADEATAEVEAENGGDQGSETEETDKEKTEEE